MAQALLQILLGILSGLVASVMVLTGNQVYQYWLDQTSKWPFRVRIYGMERDPVGIGQQVRVSFLNRGSASVMVCVTPYDSAHRSVNGWGVYEPNGHTRVEALVTVAPHAWREFFVEGPTQSGAPAQASLNFKAWFFSSERFREREYPISFFH